MKGDVYYLKHSTGNIIANFKVEKDEYGLIGTCYAGIDEDIFIADIYCKWDGCTHWRFFGEDYYPGITKDIDPYYHLCGGHDFTHHVTAMCFIWKLAEEIISTNNPEQASYIRESYNDHERIQKLIDLMLDGYEIAKV